MRRRPADITFTLPPGPEATTKGRVLLRRHLPPAVPEMTRQEIELLLTELVANAVRHAQLSPGDEIRVRLKPEDESLLVEVCDPGPGFIALDPVPRPERAGGFGLYMLDRLARVWGVTHPPTRVWFEVDLRDDPADLPGLSG